MPHVCLFQARLYKLRCPNCNEEMETIFFTDEDGHDDWHGYLCCNYCVETLIRVTAIPKEKWFKFVSAKDYNDYSRFSWEESINRTSALLRDGRAAAPVRARVVVARPPRPAPVMRMTMMPRL